MDKSKQGAEVRKDRAISSSKERRSKDSDVIMHAVYGCVCMHACVYLCVQSYEIPIQDTFSAFILY